MDSQSAMEIRAELMQEDEPEKTEKVNYLVISSPYSYYTLIQWNLRVTNPSGFLKFVTVKSLKLMEAKQLHGKLMVWYGRGYGCV